MCVARWKYNARELNVHTIKGAKFIFKSIKNNSKRNFRVCFVFDFFLCVWCKIWAELLLFLARCPGLILRKHILVQDSLSNCVQLKVCE